jgi:hypothetical protein
MLRVPDSGVADPGWACPIPNEAGLRILPGQVASAPSGQARGLVPRPICFASDERCLA